MTRARLLQSLSLLVSASFTACGEDPVAPGPDEVPAIISPAAQWSGGVVSVEWPWLEGRDQVPLFLADGQVVDVQRIGGTTLLLRLPPAGAGPVAIAVDPDAILGGAPSGVTVTLGTVEIAGFVELATAPTLHEWPLHWPGPGATTVLGADAGGQILRFDLEAGLGEPLGIPAPGAVSGYPFVGLGGGPGRVLVSDSGEPLPAVLRVWNLSSAPVIVEEIAIPHEGMLQGHLLTPDRLLLASDDNLWLYTRAPGTSDWVQSEFDRTIPHELVRSPGGTQVALMMLGSDDYGMPYVLQGDGSAPAFFLPTLASLYAGAFTPDGASLFLAAYAVDAPQKRLVRVSASTGAVEAEVVLDPAGTVVGGPRPILSGLESAAVAVTASRVLLAVSDWTDLSHSARRFRLLVFRASDLGFLADLEAPVSTGPSTEDPVLAVTADGTGALLYDYLGGKLSRFSLLPE